MTEREMVTDHVRRSGLARFRQREAAAEPAAVRAERA